MQQVTFKRLAPGQPFRYMGRLCWKLEQPVNPYKNFGSLSNDLMIGDDGSGQLILIFDEDDVETLK